MTAHAARRSLSDWLDRQLALHPTEIELGLGRVRRVAERMGLLPVPYRAISVAGTNGKGSSALLTEALLSGSGVSVGTYTSPHLLRYNERVRIDGAMADDEALCDAFEAVELAREEVSLTYFEFGTLAALWLFARAGVDVAVLEVGLGGRLDAVNIVDADVSLITHIGLDHSAWLGDDREAIGREKAGIMRARRPTVCADRNPPGSLAAHAGAVGAVPRWIGTDFDLEPMSSAWRWRDWQGARFEIAPAASVLPDNLAGALAAVTAFGVRLDDDTVARALDGFSAPGRRDWMLRDGIEWVFDVGHNAEAMQVLAEWLDRRPVAGRTHAVVGMLADKPVEALAGALAGRVDAWYAGGLPGVGRGLDGPALAERMSIDVARVYEDVVHAAEAARADADTGDRIVVCGSFYTVAAAWRGGICKR